ncbi:hypothetical protein SAMN05216354_1637 [Xylanibacter ruminicola]|uniref:Uncharacterized protein n=1 Tax=Xylanibacter ruminicola TaxID=839 RepID=A0A1H5UYZ0_XYLRU|nr:hypothetical protein [Xylanibacter ruminicola]SEF80180.1 hypothetical protein SAMN05216354_1637 [Xylanibacter ruminicola]
MNEIVVNLGDYAIYINQKSVQEIEICVRHIITLRNKEIYPIFPKADDISPLIGGQLRFVKGWYVFDSSPETLYNDVELIVSNIKKNSTDLIPILNRSTLRNPDGTMKVRRKRWKSPAKIKGFFQKSRYGVESDFEENYYVLRIKILHPSLEEYEPLVDEIEIENFIRKNLLPGLKRERMSSNLRDEINKKLTNQKVDVITYDFEKDGSVSVDATYLPIGFKSWDEFLKSFF